MPRVFRESGATPQRDALDFHPQGYQGHFDNLIVTARAQKGVFPHSLSGIGIRERSGWGYRYRPHHALDGRQREQPLGPVDGMEAAARKAALGAQIERAR
jgi:hypothetical protein